MAHTQNAYRQDRNGRSHWPLPLACSPKAELNDRRGICSNARQQGGFAHRRFNPRRWRGSYQGERRQEARWPPLTAFDPLRMLALGAKVLDMTILNRVGALDIAEAIAERIGSYVDMNFIQFLAADSDQIHCWYMNSGGQGSSFRIGLERTDGGRRLELTELPPGTNKTSRSPNHPDQTVSQERAKQQL